MNLRKLRWRMLFVNTYSAGVVVWDTGRSGVHTHDLKEYYKRFLTEYLPLFQFSINWGKPTRRGAKPR